MSYYTVAIIIPTLNEENFISRCLDTVVNQSYPFEEIDLMIVDGGSIDQTKEIVNNYISKYKNIHLLENPGKIQSVAFNIGIKKSTAPYVIRLDAHALYDRDYIKKCVEGLNADNHRGNVGGRWIILPFNESLWAKTNAILNYSRFGIGGSAFRVGTKSAYVDSVPFGAFPRFVLDIIGGMREDLPRGEDNEYNSRIRKAGYKVYFNPEIISYYFARPSLVASCRQMYANGESIGHLLFIDTHSICLRHLIPLFFVICIIGGTIISLIWLPFRYILFSGLALYFLCNIIASFIACKNNGLKYFLPLLVMFFCVHISYGLGTMIGLFAGKNFKKK